MFRYLLLMVFVFFTTSSFAEVRLFVPEWTDHLEIKSQNGDIIWQGGAEFPLSAKSAVDLAGASTMDYPLSLKFSNQETSEFMGWSLQSGQEDDSVFYLRGSVRKHYTNYPKIFSADVEISNPDTGEVYATRKTDSAGAFEFIATEIPESAPEFVKISVTNGTIFVVEQDAFYINQNRDSNNEMVAMVRKDSFFRGSVTVSTPTTAAYLAAENQRGDVTSQDLYRAHQDNLKQVTRSFATPADSDWDYETVYLNTEKEEMLIDAYSIDYQELVERVVVGTDGLKIVELMAATPELQKQGLDTYFSGLNGSWGSPTYESFFKSKPLEITIYGEGKVRLLRTIFDENSNKMVLQDEIIQGTLADNPNNFPFPTYKIPKIIVGKNETIRLESVSDEGEVPWSWSGCKSDIGFICSVSDKSTDVQLYLSGRTEPFDGNATSINNEHFVYGGEYITGREGASEENLNVISSIAQGENVILVDKNIYRVDEVNIPVDRSDYSGYKIKLTKIFDQEQVHGAYRNMETNLDYWTFYMGGAPYKKGAVVPTKWNENGKMEGFLTSDDVFSTTFDLVEFEIDAETEGLSIENSMSVQSNNEPSLCHSGGVESSIILVPKFVDLSVKYKICVVGKSSSFGIDEEAIKVKPDPKGRWVEYYVPVEFLGTFVASISGNGTIETFSTPAFQPVVKFEIQAEVDNMSITANAKDVVAIKFALGAVPVPYEIRVGEKLKHGDYSLDFDGVGASGRIKGGAYLEAGISKASLSAGVSVNAGIQEVRDPKDPDGICGNLSVVGFLVDAKLEAEFKILTIGNSYRIGRPYKKPFTLEKKQYTEEQLNNCINPSLEIEVVSSGDMIVDENGVKNKTKFKITNVTDLTAHLEIDTNRSFVIPSSKKIEVPPKSFVEVYITPNANQVLYMGPGEKSVETTFSGYFKNERGAHKRKFNKSIRTTYLVDYSGLGYLAMPLENITLSEHMLGYFHVKSVGVGIEENVYRESDSEVARYDFEFKNMLDLALKHRIFDVMESKHITSMGLSVEDIEIDRSLMSITTVFYPDEDVEGEFSPMIVNLDRIGNEFYLERFYQHETRFGTVSSHRTLVEYGKKKERLSVNNPDWFNPGWSWRVDEIFNTDILKNVYDNAWGSLDREYMDKYFNIGAERKCVDSEGNISSSYLNERSSKVSDSGRGYGYSNEGVYFEASTSGSTYGSSLHNMLVKIGSSGWIETNSEGSFNKTIGSCSYAGTLVFGSR